MITAKNYFEVIQGVDTTKLPPPLAKGHELVVKGTSNGGNWNEYNEKETIQRVFNIYFKKLDEYLAQNASKKKTDSGKKEAKKAKEKILDTQQTEPEPSIFHKAFHLLQKFIPDFVKHLKTKSKEGVLNLTGNRQVIYEFEKRYEDSYYITLVALLNDEPQLTWELVVNPSKREAEVTTETLSRPYTGEYGLDESIEEIEERGGDVGEALTLSIMRWIEDLLIENQRLIIKTKPARESGRIKGKAQTDKTSARHVEHIREEVKFIKRFVSLHNKIKSPASILSVIKSLQRAIVQKLIHKTSPLAKEIEAIQEKLVDGYNKAKGDLQITINEKDLTRLVAIAGGEEVYPSIGIIKRYIGMQGKETDQRRLELFIKQIENALDNKRVSVEDPYYEKVKAILNSVKKLKSGDSVKIGKAELNGLEGIVHACSCHKRDLGRIYDAEGKELRRCRRGTYTDAKNKGACSHNKGLGEISNGVLTAEQMANRHFEHLNFTYPWNALIGRPAKNFTIMFHGEPGAGKTTLLLKFAEYLADNFGRVLYISSEEHDASTLTAKVNELLQPLPVNLEFAPDLDTPDLSLYNFIILDSVNDLGLKLDDFKRLKKENPETAFILVLQHTKDGDYRGGKDWEHDIQIAAKVENGVVTVYRSRYGVKGSLNFFDHFHTRQFEQNQKINY